MVVQTPTSLITGTPSIFKGVRRHLSAVSSLCGRGSHVACARFVRLASSLAVELAESEVLAPTSVTFMSARCRGVRPGSDSAGGGANPATEERCCSLNSSHLRRDWSSELYAIE